MNDMLKISTEYHRGVFFVRIVGRNDNGRKLKEIFNMIDELGIRNIVLNLNKLDFLSVDQIEEISNFKENKLKKKIFIIYDQRKSRLFNNTFIHLEKELDVFAYL